MFASSSLTEHVVRGLVGLTALVCTVVWSPAHPWLFLLGLPVALVALRGCPLCWVVGLGQTIVARTRGREVKGVCTDGRCAVSPERPRRPAGAAPRRARAV